MDELAATGLSARDAYTLMTSLVAPRPIAWVSTIDERGRTNLAPFSYFQAVCSAPPTIVLAISQRPSGPKDTLANILATHELTISHVSHELAEPMNASSADVEHEVSEWHLCGVDAAPACRVRPARVALARAGMECRLTHAIPLGRPGQVSSTLVVAEVVHFWAQPGLLERDGRGNLSAIDPAKLDSVGRLAGSGYASTRDRFSLPRPGS